MLARVSTSSLKIAAVHTAHKSLGVTLQFIGRFAAPPDKWPGEVRRLESEVRGS